MLDSRPGCWHPLTLFEPSFSQRSLKLIRLFCLTLRNFIKNNFRIQKIKLYKNKPFPNTSLMIFLVQEGFLFHQPDGSNVVLFPNSKKKSRNFIFVKNLKSIANTDFFLQSTRTREDCPKFSSIFSRPLAKTHFAPKRQGRPWGLRCFNALNGRCYQFFFCTRL